MQAADQCKHSYAGTTPEHVAQDQIIPVGTEKQSLQDEDTNFGDDSDAAAPAQDRDRQSCACLEGLKEDGGDLSLLGTSLV